MKLPLVALLAVVMAVPVISVSTPSDAQVLTGRGGARAARRPARPAPPALTEAEEDRLWDAQAEIEALDGQVADLQTLGQSQGGLTAEQQTQLGAHAARRATLVTEVTRLEAKRDR